MNDPLQSARWMDLHLQIFDLMMDDSWLCEMSSTFCTHFNCCVWRCHVKVWCYCVSICYTIFLSSFFLLFLFLFHHSFEQLPCLSFFSPVSWKIWENLAVPSVVNARKFHDESLFDDLFFWSICFIFSARSAPFVS